MLYWYHPPDYWGFLAFNGRVNLQIMQAFEKEGIKFAFPTTTTYLTQEDGEPLHITLGGEAQLAS
jgi:MscS family membrane protein